MHKIIAARELQRGDLLYEAISCFSDPPPLELVSVHLRVEQHAVNVCSRDGVRLRLPASQRVRIEARA